jgi:hypothetical protein
VLCSAGKATAKPSSLSKALTMDPVLGSTQRVHVHIPRRTSPHRSPCCRTAAFDNRAIDELSVRQTHPQPYTESVHHGKAMYYFRTDLKKAFGVEPACGRQARGISRSGDLPAVGRGVDPAILRESMVGRSVRSSTTTNGRGRPECSAPSLKLWPVSDPKVFFELRSNCSPRSGQGRNGCQAG